MAQPQLTIQKNAKEFTNKVYDFEWCNDFAKARNFSISKASNDWIIILDADEVIINSNKKSLQGFIIEKGNINKVGRIKRINIMENITGNKKYIERVNRIFNRNFFCYEGIIHEQVISSDGQIYTTEHIDVTADHIGYTKEVINRTNKIKRNIDLLYISLKNKEEPYIYYQLGKAYFMLKEYNTSSEYFEKALYFSEDIELEYVSYLIETYGYSLINSGKYTEALVIEKFLDVYKNSPDFYFLLGLIYMNNSKFTQAVDSFLECTKFPNGKIEGVTTYLPYYNIGVIFEVLGEFEQAMWYYKRCGNYEQAINKWE